MNPWDVALSVLASLGGGGAIVLALSSWLGKVWASRILEADRRRYSEELEAVKNRYDVAVRAFQGEIDRTLFVHRVQFETEFKALSDIWAKLVRVAASTEALRPMGTGPGRDPKVLKPYVEEQQAALVAFSNALHEQSPFYPADIFPKLVAAQKLASIEGKEVAVECDDKAVSDSDYYRRGREHRGQLFQHVDEVSALIRRRLAALTVYGTPETQA
jgi:hypothetical protein